MPINARQPGDDSDEAIRVHGARDLHGDHHQRHGVAHGYDAPIAELNPEILVGLQKPSIDALLRSLQKHRPEASTQDDPVLAKFHHTLHLVWGYMYAHKRAHEYDVGAHRIKSRFMLDRDLKGGQDHRWQVECFLDAVNNLEVSYFLRDNLGKLKSDSPVFKVVYITSNSVTGNQIMYDPKDNATISGILSQSELLERTNVLRFSDQQVTPSSMQAMFGRLVAAVRTIGVPETSQPDDGVFQRFPSSKGK